LGEITMLYGELLRAVLAQHREREVRLMTGDAVSASIAHEIKQPLSAMTMNANAGLRWLDRAAPDLDEAKAALQRIVTNGHRAGAVIENIRALFKSDARTRTSLDVHNIIREALAVVRDDLQTHRIDVQADCNEWFPRIEGNQVQLHQVLVNLITNAIESMATEDGERVLRLRSEVHDSGSVMVSVEDTGKGVEPSAIDRIFSPLFTTRAHGMGMGLSICRSIIEAHGGRLWIPAARCHFPLHGAGPPGPRIVIETLGGSRCAPSPRPNSNIGEIAVTALALRKARGAGRAFALEYRGGAGPFRAERVALGKALLQEHRAAGRAPGSLAAPPRA